MARVGVLTGGGDCPGLNAVIRAVVRRGLQRGTNSFTGFSLAGNLTDDDQSSACDEKPNRLASTIAAAKRRICIEKLP